jgi:hypothetical protein
MMGGECFRMVSRGSGYPGRLLLRHQSGHWVCQGGGCVEFSTAEQTCNLKIESDTCCVLNWVILKRYVNVLTPSTLECEPI